MSAQTNFNTASNFSSQLIEFAGTVETAASDTNAWQPARTNLSLHPGDRLRTGPDSRATLLLSDRSVIRVNQSTTIQIQSPVAPSRRRFSLKHGALFFLNREKPADIEFETPLATGAIRGTEFLLEVNYAADQTRLALLDGAVDLKTSVEELALTAGQQALVNASGPAQVTAVLPAANLVQWSLYYPAVLNPAEIPFSDAERLALANSLAAYTQGDLLSALQKFPAQIDGTSVPVRVYRAALKLAVGQVEDARAVADSPGGIGAPLRELLGAVQFERLTALPAPANSSEWLARSYYLQSRSELPGALAAARLAAKLAPEFGFAWTRVAELEQGTGNRAPARDALRRAEQLSPHNPQNQALEGFGALADSQPGKAIAVFNGALALDGSLPDAWMGRGLAYAQLGEFENARRDFQTAAALEPHRGLFRSYLAKAWSQQAQDKLAAREFGLAQELDPADPTAWFYSALHRFQTGQVNDAVRELQHSSALNDNRSVFRSRLQLDQDEAVRSADLAAIYDDAGLDETSRRAASRAVAESYSDYSGHLFRARSLQSLEDPENFNLRFETARESELLVANLLAPPGGGNLSQLLSQADYLQYFDQRPFGFSSLSGYDSRGDWSQSATAFGSERGFSYAVDAQYLSQHGQRINNGLEDAEVSVQTKYQITAADSVYLQVGYLHDRAGDVAQHDDPNNAIPNLRATEEQSPSLFVGWHHEWSPGSHTLLLFSRLTDHLNLTNPQPSLLFLQYASTGIVDVVTDPTFALQQTFDFTLYTAELQQIWETPQQSLVVGGRYQHGSVDTQSMLTRALGAMTGQTASPGMERFSGYGYYEWRPVARFQASAGVSYDQITYPRNVDLPPIIPDQGTRRLFGPKAGLAFQPWQGGWMRGAATRSLGGLFFDNSIRLEPTEVAGITSAFRSLIPESVAGLVPAAAFNTLTAQFDQVLDCGTYFGVEAQWLKSDGSRNVGEFTNSIAFPPAFNFYLPDSPSTAGQSLRFQERGVSAYAAQLLAKSWAAGARYQLSEAKLETTFPDLAGVSGVSSLNQNQRAILNHVQLFLRFNHRSGFFAQWWTDWFQQDNRGYTPELSNADFWQHNLIAGYRLPHRRAEFSAGILNLSDRDYRLNPLNLQNDLARRRTFVTSLRVNF